MQNQQIVFCFAATLHMFLFTTQCYETFNQTVCLARIMTILLSVLGLESRLEADS